MKCNVFVVTLLALIAVSVFAFHSGTVDAKANPVIAAFPFHDDDVAIGANRLMQQGWEIFQIDRPRGLYYADDGSAVVYVWARGFGVPPTVETNVSINAEPTAPKLPMQPTPASGCHD